MGGVARKAIDPISRVGDGNPHAGSLNHGQIVQGITHRDGLCHVDAQMRAIAQSVALVHALGEVPR